MKFIVNSKDLNNAVKRASAIYNKSNTSTAEYVFFVARGWGIFSEMDKHSWGGWLPWCKQRYHP